MINKKVCKGTGKAKGHGCGLLIPIQINGVSNRVYGLGKSCKCFNKWLLNTKEGQEKLNKASLKAKKVVTNNIKKKEREEKSLNNDWSKKLQTEINSIVRTIDKGLSCLARNIKGQMHAGHVYARGGNQTIKYNLHNIHRQCAQSNHYQNDDGLLREGVIKEYGEDYMSFISGLRKTPAIHYNNKEYRELTYKSRKILKELKHKDKIYTKNERIELRNRINKELNIYSDCFCIYEL